jgi:carbon-monoxide dehydrogenase small subunit
MSEVRGSEIRVGFEVNGKACSVKAPAMSRLLDVLREELGFFGTKEGCGEGECGACSVMVNGRLVNSCLMPVIQAEGSKITTIEGLSNGPELHPVQKAFLECGGAQCGICTPGMVLAAVNLIEKCPNPAELTDAQIREGLAGNICRCTGYMKIFDSVRLAASRDANARGVK